MGQGSDSVMLQQIEHWIRFGREVAEKILDCRRRILSFAPYSIVAYDSATGYLGVAVQSKFPNVGGIVPWAKSGIGAVATQSLGNTAYWDEGLQLMAMGATAPEAMRIVMRSDARLSQRQVGMVDAHGNAASWTGDSCFDWAGGRTTGADGQIVTGAKGADDEAVDLLANCAQDFAVVSDGYRNNRSPDLRAFRQGGCNDIRRQTRPEPNDVLGDIPERSGIGREGSRAAGVDLPNEACRVDLLAEDDHAAKSSCLRARGDLHRSKYVRRPVGARHAGVPHSTGENDRCRTVMKQVDEEGGLLDRVRPLCDHDAVDSAGSDFAHEGVEVGEAERCPRHAPEIPHLNRHVKLVKPRHASQ